MPESKIPVTVLIQTKNEELGIGACIRALNDFAQVIVVDSMSADSTQSIATQLGAEVIEFDWNGAYPKKKQWQLDNVATRFAWVLFMDADETPTAGLVAELQSVFASKERPEAAFDINLEYVFAGKVLRHGHRVTKRALVHRDRVFFPEMDDLDVPGMGELEGHYQPEANGKISRLKNHILHNDLDPVESWFARHNRYSDWESSLRVNSALRTKVASRRTLKGRIFDAVPLKPLLFFVYAFIVRAGFLDGRPGLDYALALSFYYWQIGVKTREKLRR